MFRMLIRRSSAALAVLLGLAGCTTYVGVAKEGSTLYLTGATTHFFVFTSSWVRRCTETASGLVCEDLDVTERPAKSPADGAAHARAADAGTGGLEGEKCLSNADCGNGLKCLSAVAGAETGECSR